MPPEPGVHTRAASPDDVPFLAEVVLAASRSHLPRAAWDLMIEGDDARRLRFLEALLVARPSWCHWANFRVAEVAGEPAAALSAFPAEGGGLAPAEAILPEVARAEGWSEAELAGAFTRMAPFLGCIPKEDPAGWNVEWVATRARHRRRGLVARLLDDVLAEGRRRGHPCSQLLLLIGNTAAQGGYEKKGYRVVDERRSEAFEQALECPGLARMECSL